MSAIHRAPINNILCFTLQWLNIRQQQLKTLIVEKRDVYATFGCYYFFINDRKNVPAKSAMVKLHRNKFVIFRNLRRDRIMRQSSPLPISPDKKVGTYSTTRPNVRISEPAAGPSMWLSSKLRRKVSFKVISSLSLKYSVEMGDVLFISNISNCRLTHLSNHKPK